MKRILATAFGLALGATAAMAQTAEGIWALMPEDCGKGFEPGNMVVDLEEGYVAFYESDCTIESWDAIGEAGAAWQAVLNCAGEGETWTVNAIFALDMPFDGAPIRLVEIDLDDGFVIGRYGCAGPER